MARKKILLVGWDAADWQIIHPLLEAGALPNLKRLIEEGAMGNLKTLEPPLSPILWNSIATGKRGDKHGILGFSHPDPVTGKIRPYGTASRKVKALWNILSEAGWRCHVVNWLASHPAEKINGISVSEAFIRHLHAGSPNEAPPVGGVNPPSLVEELLRLAVRPDAIEGQTIGLFVPRLGEIDQDKDPQLVHLAEILAGCFTTHAVTTWLMEKEPWDFLAVYYPALDHLGHAFMRYRAPKLASISEREFDFYKDVMDGGYRIHDETPEGGPNRCGWGLTP